VLWAIVALLTVPFYVLAAQRRRQKTRASSGIVQASANSTLDQTKLYTRAI
jgi:hypothetical protein